MFNIFRKKCEHDFEDITPYWDKVHSIREIRCRKCGVIKYIPDNSYDTKAYHRGELKYNYIEGSKNE